MARYAIIDDATSTVKNVGEFADPSQFPTLHLVQSDTAQIGDIFTPPNTFTKPAQEAPTSGTNIQVRRAFIQLGWLTQMENFINGLTTANSVRDIARQEWEHREIFDKDSQLMQQFKTGTNKTNAQMLDMMAKAQAF